MTAAEVVAKLRVEGGQHFISTMKQASDAVKGLGKSGAGMGALGDIMKTMMGVAGGNLLTQGINGIAGIAGGIVNLGAQAVKASSDIEAFKKSLMALGYTAEQAQGKYDFLAQLAIPSQFGAGELQAGAQMLEAINLRAEKFMPLVAKLAMGMGRSNPEDMMQAVTMFTRLSQGQMPEMDTQTKFGMTSGALAQYGAKFDKNNSLVSSADEAMRAAESLILDRYGNIFKQMETSTKSRLATIGDIWNQMLGKVGDGIMNVLGPAITRLGEWMRYALSSGWLEGLVSKIGGIFGGMKDTTWVDNIMAGLMTVAEMLPKLLGSAADYFGQKINAAMAGAAKIVGYVASGAMGDMMKAQYYDFLKAIGPPQGYFAKRMKHDDPAAEWRKTAEYKAKLWQDQQDVMSDRASRGIINPVQLDFMGRLEQRIKGFAKFRRTMGTGEPTDTGTGYFTNRGGGGVGVIDGPIGDIARNTARTVDAVERGFGDLKRHMIGGGPISESVLSPVSLHRGKHAPMVKVDAGSRNLNMALGDLLQDTIAQLARQGLIKVL